MQPPEEPREDPALGPSERAVAVARGVSGLIWTAVFLVLTLVLWNLLGWLVAGAIEDRLLLSALPLLGAAAIVTCALPRPAGTPLLEGLALTGPAADRDFLLGFALAGATAAGSVGALAAAGLIEFVHAPGGEVGWAGGGWLGGMAVSFAVLVPAALGEELFFRGYGFQQLARLLTPPGAALATGLGFGFVHGSNPGVSEIAVANTVGFGLLFGWSLVRARSLWPAFGMHVGWNFALVNLGAPLSGLRIKVADLETVPAGESLWHGGAYGPEGGLAATAALAVLAVAISATWPGRTNGRRLIWDDGEPEHGGSSDA